MEPTRLIASTWIWFASANPSRLGVVLCCQQPRLAFSFGALMIGRDFSDIVSEFEVEIPSLPVAGNWTKILPNNPQRVALMLGNSLTYHLWYKNLGTTPNFGIQMGTAIPPQRITASEIGGLICAEWWVFTIGSTALPLWGVVWKPTR